MTPEDRSRDSLTAAESKVAGYLETLRGDRPRPPAALVPRALRTARWQRAVRGPLRVTGLIAAAVADGLGTLLGLRPRRGAR